MTTMMFWKGCISICFFQLISAAYAFELYIMAHAQAL